jgi:hypothetical protein
MSRKEPNMGDMPERGDMAEEEGAVLAPPSLADRLFALEMRIGHLEDVLDGLLQLLPHRAPMAEKTPTPRCPVCCCRMPTPAHVFLHQHLHGSPSAWLETGRVGLYDRIAQVMQAYKEVP